MKIDILCTDPLHPVNAYLDKWLSEHQDTHDIRLLHKGSELSEGDILFLVSCSEIIKADQRSKYHHVMVLHASPLPKGRGWSPHIWAILDGAEDITLSLLVAEDVVDSGDIWAQTQFAVPKSAVFDEINAALFEAELHLLSKGVALVESGATPTSQIESAATYYPKRSPADSKLDPKLSIEAQFDKMRVADPVRYPTFFELHGTTYTLTLRKADRDT